MSEALDSSVDAQALQAAVKAMPVHEIDVSQPELYEQDSWRPYFERLRNEEPVHLNRSELFGDFWSVTRFDDIQYVDKHHEIFSSEPSVLLADQPEDYLC